MVARFVMARGHSSFSEGADAGRIVDMESGLQSTSRLGTLVLEHRDALLAISREERPRLWQRGPGSRLFFK
jgi:hypothetical protein